MKLAVLLMFVLAFAFVQATVILNDADGQRNEPAEFNEDDSKSVFIVTEMLP
jgi:cytochrome c biogenesis protein ResB